MTRSEGVGVLAAIAACAAGMVLLEHRTTRVDQERRAAEARALAAEDVASAREVTARELQGLVDAQARESATLREQLEAVRRATPTARTESVVTHETGEFEVPMAVDCPASAHPPRADTGAAATSPEDAVAPSSAPILNVRSTEARLETDAGTIAVVGETVVACVGGGCVRGWERRFPWSADATRLFVRADPDPLLKGWGIGLTAVCVRDGCGVGPAGLWPRKRWTTRAGREVLLDGSAGVTLAGEISAAATVGLRF